MSLILQTVLLMSKERKKQNVQRAWGINKSDVEPEPPADSGSYRISRSPGHSQPESWVKGMVRRVLCQIADSNISLCARPSMVSVKGLTSQRPRSAARCW